MGRGGSTHGKMREVICSRSLRGSIQFSRRQGGEYGIGFEIKRQADGGLRGGDFDRAGKAGGTKQGPQIVGFEQPQTALFPVGHSALLLPSPGVSVALSR